MAARLLRHNSLDAMAATSWAAVISPVPASRALVGRVVVANNTGTSSVRFFLSIATTATSTGLFVDTTLNAGEQFEQMVVIPAGKQLNVYSMTANGVVVTVMGEEVDN